MYIIVGLGNPGREYENTRHNIGFDVIDKLADQENIGVLEKKHKAIIGKGVIAGQKCILAKPQTFMNLSGESVRALLDYYKADETADLIVISDDISLDVGQLRIRKKGSAGGHNGLKNIIGSGRKAQGLGSGGLCAGAFLTSGAGNYGRSRGACGGRHPQDDYGRCGCGNE